MVSIGISQKKKRKQKDNFPRIDRTKRKEILIYFCNIKMSEKTLKLDNIKVNKNNFMLLSKQLI